MHEPQINLENKQFRVENRVVNFDGIFYRERHLDDALWFNPTEAPAIAKNLLKQRQGKLNVGTHRIVAKMIAQPLFEREYDGVDTDDATREMIAFAMPFNARVLERYLDLSKSSLEDGAMLKQMITELVVMQLVYRSLDGSDNDTIILLPIGPSEEYGNLITDMTVLERRNDRARAQLVTTDLSLAETLAHKDNNAKLNLHPHDPRVQQRIHLQPRFLTAGTTDIYALGEILAKEPFQPITALERAAIDLASSYVFSTIGSHLAQAVRP